MDELADRPEFLWTVQQGDQRFRPLRFLLGQRK